MSRQHQLDLSSINSLDKRKIFYVKTHKTGSSTLYNILGRYAVKHHYNFILPKKGNSFNFPKTLDYHAIANYPKFDVYRNGDIILNHLAINLNQTKLSKKVPISQQLDQILPIQNFFKFTILRSPVKNFESIFTYFQHVNKNFIQAKTTQNFIQNPELYSQKYQIHNKNFNFLHFGFENFGKLEYAISETEIQSAIQQVGQFFDLVLIADYFDESILLLRRILNLDFDDLVYFKKQERKIDSTVDSNTISSSDLEYTKS